VHTQFRRFAQNRQPELQSVTKHYVDYLYSPDLIYNALQYSIQGYLAPGAIMRLFMAGEVEVNNGHVFASSLRFSPTITTPGAFSLSDQAMELIDPRIFHYNDGLVSEFEMQFNFVVEIETPWGAGESWVKLDPGMAIAAEGSNFFPWLAANPNPVPEPSSFVMLAGLVVTGAAFGGLRRIGRRK
jgi:hypothetical protein